MGQCYLCRGRFSKRGMSRHLKSCTANHSAFASAVKVMTAEEKTKIQDCLHVRVEGRHLPEYWMHLEVPASATLYDLDLFLRDIWLECCGHLSLFTINGQGYSREPDDEFYDKGMDVPLNRVVSAGEYFNYEYDFGSTTELTLRLVGKINKCSSGKKISILARNEHPQYRCSYCENIAVQICAECQWDSGGWLCEKCAEEHECDEDMLLPVVNSPRVGVCAYRG